MLYLRKMVAATVFLALLVSGCTTGKPPATPPAKNTPETKQPKHPELIQPFESALLALKAMNQSGLQKDFVAAEKHFKEFRTHWATVRPNLREVDPKLEVHIEDGAVELDHEFTKPQDQIRVYELDEETVKLGRLLSKGAEALGVAVRPELVQKDPRDEMPFNKEVKVNITMTDHKFEPSTITLDQHTKVTFVLNNRGLEMHEFELGHYAMKVEDILQGQTQELTLVLLDAGEFEFACHIPGHYEVGMFGRLIVKPAELKKQ